MSSVSFFGIFDALYSFFAASTHRWEVLVEKTGVSVKRLSTTSWSAHHAAVKPVAHNFDGVVDAVETLCDRSENLETRGGAERLLPSVNDFTFLCYLYFWFDVLEEVEAAQQYLQTKALMLDKVITKIEALRIFLLEEREDIVENSIEKALRKAAEFGISTEKRTRYRKKMPGEEGEIRHEAPSVKEENRTVMLECIDRFHAEIETQSKGLKEIAALFKVVGPKSLMHQTSNYKLMQKHLQNFMMRYLRVNSWLKYHDYEGILLLLRLMQMMPIIGPLCNFWSLLLVGIS